MSDKKDSDASTERKRYSERLEELASENRELRERISSLEETIEADTSQSADNDQQNGNTVTKSDDDSHTNVSRRSAMKGLLSAGILGLAATGTGSVSAATDGHLGDSWSGSPSGRGLQIVKKNTGIGLNTIMTPDSGDTTALRGKADSDSGVGVKGLALSGSGSTKGVKGRVDSSQGLAVEAVNRATSGSGTGFAVWGRTYMDGGTALYGHADATSGATRGIFARVDSPDGAAIRGRVTASGSGDSQAIYATNQADDGVGIDARALGSGTTYGVKATASSSNGYGLYTPDDAKVNGTVEIGGDLEVSGTKNFVQTVSTDAGEHQVTYTAVEAGRARTETSGVAELDGGIARITLPTHFGLVTSGEEPIVVQVTPYATESVSPQVSEKSTERVVVEDFSDSDTDYAFAYTVKGVRKGFEDEQVIQADD